MISLTYLAQSTCHNHKDIGYCLLWFLFIHLREGNIIHYCIFHSDEAEDEDDEKCSYSARTIDYLVIRIKLNCTSRHRVRAESPNVSDCYRLKG